MRLVAGVRRFGVVVGLLLVLVLVLAACGDDGDGGDEAGGGEPAEDTGDDAGGDDAGGDDAGGDDAGGDAGDDAGGDAAGDDGGGSAEGPPEGEEGEFAVAFTSIGLSSVPLLAAVDELNSQGYSIETPELAESELVTEGTAQGQFAFGSGANNATMAAVAQGAPLQWIIDRVSNEWMVYATQDVEGCEGLVNSRVAIHSPGSVSGAMIEDWVANNCEDVLPDYEPLIIEGSQNRLAALLSGEIDASPIELSDSLVLEEEGGGEFQQVVAFAEELPELHPTSVYGNSEFMDANPGATTALVRELLEQHRQINSEDGYLLGLLEEHLPEQVEEDPDTMEDIAAEYVEREMFAEDGGLTPEAVEYTLGFFGPDGTGDVEEPIEPDVIADLSYLEEALNELDG